MASGSPLRQQGTPVRYCGTVAVLGRQGEADQPAGSGQGGKQDKKNRDKSKGHRTSEPGGRARHRHAPADQRWWPGRARRRRSGPTRTICVHSSARACSTAVNGPGRRCRRPRPAQPGRLIQQQFIHQALAQHADRGGLCPASTCTSFTSRAARSRSMAARSALPCGLGSATLRPTFAQRRRRAVYQRRRVDEHLARWAAPWPGAGWCFQSAVDDHQARLAQHVRQAHVQLRVVFQHRADAGEYGTGPCTPRVAASAVRRGRGDPPAAPVGQGGAPSSELAAFSRTQGVPRAMRLAKPMLSSRDASAATTPRRQPPSAWPGPARHHAWIGVFDGHLPNIV